ncbi:MAG: class II glutamine amidotransferase [Puniceicoccales bacterium]|nr:class II glutamine amidotransferase [Puniceicoccales bacterium]
MSDTLNHECGIAFIRLLKSFDYYAEKYSTPLYAFSQLMLLMEKQHNRGQDGAGIGCVKLNIPHGQAFMFRDRDASPHALTNIFSRQLDDYKAKTKANIIVPEWTDSFKKNFDFAGEILIGHLRYCTSGGLGVSACHPFYRKSIWPTRNLMLAGNFNFANARDLNESLIQRGAHPIFSTDTQTILEEIGFWLDEEHSNIYRALRYDENFSREQIPPTISERLDIAKILRLASNEWDGAYTLIGLIGNGDSFLLRDPHGIRPCFYLQNDEIFAAASERAALMTVFNATYEDIHELPPGNAIIIKSNGSVSLEEIIPPLQKKHCSFERIYFSRGNDPEIYAERKTLGAALVPQVLNAIENDFERSVFSYIPNTAETAFYGFIHEIYRNWCEKTKDLILNAAKQGTLDKTLLDHIFLNTWPRSEKFAHKDIKLRTFIADEESRKRLASLVYDISYGVVRENDNLVVIDDSIVRGTTLRESILRIFARPNPRRIIICSTAPQIRYPDFYGIDMSEIDEFLVFQAALKLCEETGKKDLLLAVYKDCIKQLQDPDLPRQNHVKRIYEAFTEDALSQKAAELVRPRQIDWKGELSLVYQSIQNLHTACPTSLGDWYFTGNYPTKGGFTAISRAYVSFYENYKK